LFSYCSGSFLASVLLSTAQRGGQVVEVEGRLVT
jgi:hypothetical protein